jgi:hypothetical protein
MKQALRWPTRRRGCAGKSTKPLHVESTKYEQGRCNVVTEDSFAPEVLATLT